MSNNKQNNELIRHALSMWINYIETGDVILSRNDAIESNQHKKLKKLDSDQVNLTIKLKNLMDDYND